MIIPKSKRITNYFTVSTPRNVGPGKYINSDDEHIQPSYINTIK